MINLCIKKIKEREKKHVMKKFIVVLMFFSMCVISLAGCGSSKAEVDELTVTAEEGSKEEGRLQETIADDDTMEVSAKDYFANCDYVASDSVAKALMKVKAGTADIALVDSVTAYGMVGTNTEYSDLVVNVDNNFGRQEYVIGFRKGSNLEQYVSEAIDELYADGTVAQLAEKYNLSDLLILYDPEQRTETGDSSYAKGDAEAAVESDWEDVSAKGEMTIGMTLFEPMNYYDEDGNFVGFDTELAEAVGERLGIKTNFVEIDWNSKEIELNSKNIDCIWNGMCDTTERRQTMTLSKPYLYMTSAMVMKADREKEIMSEIVTDN